MRRFLFPALALTLAVLALTAGMAKADRLSVNMTTREIAITSNFTGAKIVLYGAIRKLADRAPVPHPITLEPVITRTGPVEDIIVIIKGPPEEVTVRRKEKVAGVWVNNDNVTFEKVPGFYFVASTRPIGDIINDDVRRQNEVGADFLSLPVDAASARDNTPSDVARFREALVRRKTQENLYGIDESGVTLQDNILFNMNLSIPANVPVGDYVARILLLRDGIVIGSEPLTPRVAKSGFESWVYNIAHRLPFIYGFAAVAIAMFAGWFAAWIFRQT